MDKSLLQWDNIESRKAFIFTAESSIYGGTNIEGKDVTVIQEKGEGMEVWTPTHDDWNEVVYYGKNGNQEGVSYKRSKD